MQYKKFSLLLIPTFFVGAFFVAGQFAIGQLNITAPHDLEGAFIENQSVIELSWSHDHEDDSFYIYNIWWVDSGGHENNAETNQTNFVLDVQQEGDYKFQVRACRENVCSNFSDLVAVGVLFVEPLEDELGVVSSLKAEFMDDEDKKEIYLRWEYDGAVEDVFYQVSWIDPAGRGFGPESVTVTNFAILVQEEGEYKFRVSVCSTDICSEKDVGESIKVTFGSVEPEPKPEPEPEPEPSLVNINGRVFLGDNVVADAFVWAIRRLDDGTTQTVKVATDSNGFFSLKVETNTEWRLKASKKIEGYLHEGEVSHIKISRDDILRNIYLERTETQLSEPSEKTVDSAVHNIVTVPDGPELEAPERSIAESGQVRIIIESDTFTASKGDKNVVGLPHVFRIKDTATEQEIRQFRDRIRITIPYKLEDVTKIGATEDDIVLGFWDEDEEEWKTLDDSQVDKVNRRVTATTDHFTRFAVLTLSSQVDTSHILDGDLISAEGDFDIYIVKRVGSKKFKRLVLNPEIFNSYGHLSWDKVKTVTHAELDEFVLANLTMEVYADGTPVNGRIFETSPMPGSMTMGIARWVNMTPQQFEASGYDWDAIFKINHFEATPDKYYTGGAPITF